MGILYIFVKNFTPMNSSTISITVDPNLKNRFAALCHNRGISISSAMNMFMKKVVRDNILPFNIEEETIDTTRENARNALKEMRRIVACSDKPEMSLDEINRLINDVRNDAK